MTSHPSERRRAPRAKASFPVQLNLRAEAAPATLKDISSNGLCCRFHEPIREMTLVHMDLRLPGTGSAHGVDGVVVRCDKLRGESPPAYEVAVYFTGIAPEARAAIHGFVTTQLAAGPLQAGAERRPSK